MTKISTKYGDIEVYTYDTLGTVEILFRGKGCDLIDIARVALNDKKQSLETFVYADPSDEDYTDKFEVTIRDIEDAMSVPF